MGEGRGRCVERSVRRAGAHPVQVHEFETGKKRGSVDTLRRLAEALGVLVDDLV